MSLTHTIPADVASIERELRHLWRSEAEAERDAAGPLLCARTLNLLVYAPAEETPEEIAVLLDPITAEHPCRAILIQETKGVEKLEARVSASCLRMADANRYVARELISLQMREINCDQLQSVVTPLLVPDLPVFLWWRGAAEVDSELFSRLIKRCARVIIDFTALRDAWSELPRLARSIGQHTGRTAFTDLAWSRLTQWRQLTAQFFDSPALVHYLARLDRVVVEHGAKSGRPESPPADAMLFVAWLARLLGWRRSGAFAGGHGYRLTAHGRDIVVEFKPREAENAGLAGIRLSTEQPEAASFSVSVAEGGKGLATCTEVHDKWPMRRIVRSNALSEAEMIGSELDVITRDTLYEETLATTAELSGTA